MNGTGYRGSELLPRPSAPATSWADWKSEVGSSDVTGEDTYYMIMFSLQELKGIRENKKQILKEKWCFSLKWAGVKWNPLLQMQLVEVYMSPQGDLIILCKKK